MIKSASTHARPRLATFVRGSTLLFAMGFSMGELSAQGIVHRVPTSQGDVVLLDSFKVESENLGRIEAANQLAFSSPAVVDILNDEDLQNTGALDLTVALDKLLPSFTWPPSYNSGNSVTDVKSVQMRGTAPGFTLVLVNGKRYHRSSRPTGQLVDINHIPISAIDRIEVVRDGTSTIFGGDAVASAINIVLKRADSGGEATFRLGKYQAGDGINRSGSISVGNKLGSDGGFLRASFTFLNKQSTDRSGPNLNQVLDGMPQNVNRDRWGDGRTKSHQFWINSELPLTRSLRAYLFGGYGFVDGRSGNQPQRWHVAANDVTRYPEGHQPIANTVTEDITVATGLLWGDVNNGIGQFDLGVMYGWAKSDDFSWDSVSVSYGADSQTDFYRGSYFNDEITASLDWEKNVFGRLPHPLTLRAGVSYRDEVYKNKAGDEQSWNQGPIKIVYDPRNEAPRVAPAGNTGQKGLAPYDVVNIPRDVLGVYFGAETYLTEKIQIGAVARFEDYSDAGDATTVQASIRYDITPRIAVRGAAGTAFSPPVAAQTGSVGNSVDATTGLWTRRLTPGDPIAQALGSSPLEPATSANFGFGVVYQPTARLSFSVDGYQLEIDNQIATTNTLTGPLVQELFASIGDFETEGANFFANGIYTRHRGLELSAKYHPKLPAGAGDLRISLGLSLMKNELLRVKDRDPGISSTTLFNGESTRRNIEEVKPEEKLVLTLNYTLGKWSVAPAVFYYGETFWYRNPTAQLVPPLNNLRYAPAWIGNLNIGYRHSDRLHFTVGGTNIANKMPEKSPFPNSGLDQYWHTVAYGSAGAFFFGSVNYRFR